MNLKSINRFFNFFPMRRIITSLMIILLLSTFLGCTRQLLVTTYYLLDYKADGRNEKLKLPEPLPYRVQVMNFKIPRSFDSMRIIARYSTHQINYYRYSLWAVRPQVAMADLLTQHINTYQLFDECKREFLSIQPDYEITGEIHQIEKIESEGYTAAHLKMTFEFYDRDKNKLTARHSFDRSIDLTNNNDMTIFAKALSDIINQEADKFLVKIVYHFNPPEVDSLKVKK